MTTAQMIKALVRKAYKEASPEARATYDLIQRRRKELGIK